MDQKQKSEKYESKILIVDFQPIVRLGLIHLINNTTGLKVCGEAENAYETIEVIKFLKPDMAIVDISIRCIENIKLIENIRQWYPKFPILFFSMLDEFSYAERLIRAGANGYLMKHEGFKNIIKAIRCILFENFFISDKVAAKFMYNTLFNQSKSLYSPIDLLSNRELDVFQLIGLGYGKRRIAEELFLSTRTVEAYCAHIKDKLNLKDGEELLQKAIQWVQSEK